MVIKVSPIPINGEVGRDDYEAGFLPRLAHAEAEGRVTDPRLVNAMLRRGRARHTPRRLSLSEQEGDWN